MSDIQRVKSNTKRAVMSEVAVLEAREMLETLMKREHRGPTDTWTAARDRTAIRVGIEPSQAKRLWQRWQDMKDVSGGVYRAIRNAYDAQCEHNEKMAALHRQRAEELVHGGQTDQINMGAIAGMDSVSARAATSSPQALPRAN